MEVCTPTPADVEAAAETLHDFEDYETVLSIIKTVVKGGLDPYESEHLMQTFKKTFDKYLEQRYLLDSHLREVVQALLKPVRSLHCTDEMLHTCMGFLVVVTKARGYKAVVNHLPHEVSDIEPVLSLLERLAPDDIKLRSTSYMLLLWLGVLSMVPFQLSRLDSGDANARPVAERIFDVVKASLAAVDKASSASTFLCAHFITRPDIKDLYFDDFMLWLQQHIDSEGEERTINMLSALAMIFKIAKRDSVTKHAHSIMALLIQKNLFHSNNIVIKKLAMKLCQRIGLCFLPVNLASWRHLRTVKKLSDSPVVNGQLSEVAFPVAHENGEFDVPEIVEDVLDKLLEGLEYESLLARLSAAKGIGRIASRLPRAFASEVVSSVFSTFENQASEVSLHGGCLALAELGRRGTLLPDQLPDVVESVLPCLVFDQQLGKHTLGMIVRDAACYVCWTLGRSYNPCHLAPFVNAIAGSLVSTALFDREVVCRRAAAAAFQECVGRLGTFPHGIDIITVVNYFSVALVRNCYLHLSLQVAKFIDYTQPLIWHLVEKKSGHWDPSIRTLCSRALFMLTVDDPGFVRQTCVPKLLDALRSRQLNARLGALLSLGEVVHSLCELGEKRGETVQDALGGHAVEVLKELATNYEEAKLFSSIGGDQMKAAFCFFIYKLSISQFPIYKSRSVLDQWLSVITQCLHRDDSSLRVNACTALSALLEEYCREEPDICDEIVTGYLEGLESATEGVRCNFAHTLGSLPSFLQKRYLEVILGRLKETAMTEGRERIDSKKEAVLSLARLCVSVSIGEGGVTRLQIEAVLNVLIRGMDDYTRCPKKGDAGVAVRMACMTSFKELVCHLASAAPDIIPETCVPSMMRAIAQQCVEPVDQVCCRAIKTFIELLYSVPEIPFIPHREEARKMLPENLESLVKLCHPKETFPYLKQLLALGSYREPLLKGLLVSVGAMSDSFFMTGKETLLSYFSLMKQDETLEESVYGFLIRLWDDGEFWKRANIKYTKAMDHLAISGAFNEAPPEFIIETQRSAWRYARRKKSFPLLEALSSMLASWLQFEGDVRKMVLNKLLILLRHTWKQVRIVTAIRLYESLLLYTVLNDEENLEEACAILSETTWSNDADIDAPIRRLRSLLAIESEH